MTSDSDAAARFRAALRAEITQLMDRMADRHDAAPLSTTVCAIEELTACLCALDRAAGSRLIAALADQIAAEIAGEPTAPAVQAREDAYRALRRTVELRCTPARGQA